MTVQCALRVSAAEAEQKLMAFLARRVEAPTSMFHKWIRSGQVRVNGGRVKAFHRLSLDDAVRVPPFAELRELTLEADASAVQAMQAPLPPCIYEDEHIMLLHKPSGLPVHPGTGHTDSISTRLALQYGHCAFVPSPAHRLDKASSGILAIGKTYIGLRNLQDLFARRQDAGTSVADSSRVAGILVAESVEPESTNAIATSPAFEKIYLAWLCGDCPWDTPRLIEHRLAKLRQGSIERVSQHEQGQEAQSIAHCVRRIVSAGQVYSLVRVELLTGRTHQIRAQMSLMGFPLVGDPRYGGRVFSTLLLHAYRLVLPQGSFEVFPIWPDPFAIDTRSL